MPEPISATTGGIAAAVLDEYGVSAAFGAINV